MHALWAGGVVAVMAGAWAAVDAYGVGSAGDTPAATRGKANLGPPARSSPATRDVVALDLYKQAESEALIGTERRCFRAITLYHEAIARDSTFASPYVGLALAYLYRALLHGSLDEREAFPLVKEMAQRALQLDESLANAHAVLGS